MLTPWEMKHRVEELQQLGGPSQTYVDVDHWYGRELGQNLRDILLICGPWPVVVVVVICVNVISVHLEKAHT